MFIEKILPHIESPEVKVVSILTGQDEKDIPVMPDAMVMKIQTALQIPINVDMEDIGTHGKCGYFYRVYIRETLTSKTGFRNF